VRAKWDDCMAAYDIALTRCWSPAPWFVVPADRKWVRDWAVTRLLLETFRQMDLHYPPRTVDVKALEAQLKEQQQD
jgi:polyphosphate kinase 2 (PPK2 family)